MFYDRYDVPDLVDMSIKDAYLAILFQQVFWKRRAEKALLLQTLRNASLDQENEAYASYTKYLDVLYSGEAKKGGGIDTKKAQAIMEEESKKAYIVTPVSYGLRMKRGNKK